MSTDYSLGYWLRLLIIIVIVIVIILVLLKVLGYVLPVAFLPTLIVHQAPLSSALLVT